MSLFRVPITNWKKSVYKAALFESAPEFQAALLLDGDVSVRWWFRNDPVQFRISTPAGHFEPDFVYEVKSKDLVTMRILEVKGEHLWNGPGSVARIKAAGAISWAAAIAAAKIDPLWEFHEVLGQDAENSTTLGGMLDKAVERFETKSAVLGGKN